MVDGFDNKATLFCYVDFVLLLFLADLKISFCYETPCNIRLSQKKNAVKCNFIGIKFWKLVTL